METLDREPVVGLQVLELGLRRFQLSASLKKAECRPNPASSQPKSLELWSHVASESFLSELLVFAPGVSF